MSILRKINLGDWRIVIEQRADAFHDVEADIRDFSRAQPFQNFAALKGDWQIAQSRDRKIEIGGVGELALDPVFFFGDNHCRAPNALANVSSEVLLQIRNDSPADTIAERRQIFVRCVFAKFQSMLANIIVDFVPPDSKKRANNCKIGILNPAFRKFSNRAKTGRSGTTKQVDQKSFDQIVGVMCEKNGATSVAPGYLRKKLIARFPSRGFDRDFLSRRERTHIRRPHFNFDIAFGGKFFDEARISGARPATELVIQMAEDQFSVAAFD